MFLEETAEVPVRVRCVAVRTIKENIYDVIHIMAVPDVDAQNLTTAL